jgi:hypothetical protein
MSEEFEGAKVVDFQAKLPAVTVECDDYKRGTILRLAVEVRVKGVSHDEDKDGNLIRLHKMGIEDIEVVSAFDPEDSREGVSGSLAGGAPAPDDEGVGLEIGSTSDQWPDGVAKTDDGRSIDLETGEVSSPNGSEPTEEEEDDAGNKARQTVDAGF